MPCELMAIGDSLFNGVRSLTINAQLAQWSAPAQVARALGVADFAIPDYPRNVIVNFEEWIGEIINIPAILDEVSGNIAFWNTQPRSAAPQFDNIAIASTTWADMYQRSWRSAQGEIETINHQVAAGQTTYLDNIDKLFFAFNTRFLLNPSGNASLPALSPLQIVAQRLPRRLLVCIGANNGLWPMAFSSAACPGIGQVNGQFGPNDLAQLYQLFTQLRGLPAGVQHIYVNTLPLPSTAPNMMPPDDDFSRKPGPGGFFPTYENRFGFNYAKLTGAQVRANDDTVTAVNQRMAELAAADPRIHLVPIDQALLRYDFKTDAAAKTIAVGGRTITNLMIDGGTDALTGQDFWDGGLAGLDGLHPTIVGYNLMARTILDTIVASEAGFQPPGALPSVQDACNADTLLQNLPSDWDELMYAWRDLREIFDIGGGPVVETLAHTQMKSLMRVVQFKMN